VHCGRDWGEGKIIKVGGGRAKTVLQRMWPFNKSDGAERDLRHVAASLTAAGVPVEGSRSSLDSFRIPPALRPQWEVPKQVAEAVDATALLEFKCTKGCDSPALHTSHCYIYYSIRAKLFSAQCAWWQPELFASTVASCSAQLARRGVQRVPHVGDMVALLVSSGTQTQWTLRSLVLHWAWWRIKQLEDMKPGSASSSPTAGVTTPGLARGSSGGTKRMRDVDLELLRLNGLDENGKAIIPSSSSSDSEEGVDAASHPRRGSLSKRARATAGRGRTAFAGQRPVQTADGLRVGVPPAGIDGAEGADDSAPPIPPLLDLSATVDRDLSAAFITFAKRARTAEGETAARAEARHQEVVALAERQAALLEAAVAQLTSLNSVLAGQRRSAR